MGKILSEFKEFAMKGNVVDMAVGVIIGGAFGKIVSSLVNDVIMPVVGIATGGLDFKEHKLILKAAVMNGEEVVTLSGHDLRCIHPEHCRLPHCCFLYIHGYKIHEPIQEEG